MKQRARAVSIFVALAALAMAALPLQRTSAQLDDRAPSSAAIPTAIPTLILPPVPSVAPGYRAPQAAPSAARIIGVTQQPFVGISLQDAIAMALVKNPNLAISASNFRIARYNIVQVKGAYDVALHLQPQSNFSVNPPQNFLAAGPGEVGIRYPPRNLHDGSGKRHPESIRLSLWPWWPDRERHELSGRHPAEFAPITIRFSTRTTRSISPD